MYWVDQCGEKPTCKPKPYGFTPMFHQVSGKENIYTIPDDIYISGNI